MPNGRTWPSMDPGTALASVSQRTRGNSAALELFPVIFGPVSAHQANCEVVLANQHALEDTRLYKEGGCNAQDGAVWLQPR
jgi:hypothetical protein